ncbi:MAG: TIGR04372 family glycosyltransferase [SAR324 cluster bacterium]|nr:TIGR04372 family glycosyltransferase [SAR324 cluster bacterium]
MFPFKQIRIGFINTERIGHLALNLELFCRKQQSGYSKDWTHIFLAGNPCNQQLLTMWKRHLHIFQIPVLWELLWPVQWLWKTSRFFEPLEMLSNEYEDFQTGHPTLFFTETEKEKGKNFLLSQGIDLGKHWYVCVFARDEAYLNVNYPGADWGYHHFRNADIDQFIPAIEYIINRGGFVIRMGHHVGKPLKFRHPQVIDYALSARNDFADIYLMAHCRFVLGTTSGICDIAMIFDVPRIGTNFVPIGHMPHGKHCLYLPKLLFQKEMNQPVPFKWILSETRKREHPWNFDGETITKAGYEYVENKPEDILAITQEMMDRLEGIWKPSMEDQELLLHYFNLFPQDHWSKMVKTPIGLEFLKKYREFFIS